MANVSAIIGFVTPVFYNFTALKAISDERKCALVEKYFCLKENIG